MKKILFTLALFVQVGLAMAGKKNKEAVQVRHDHVKMFQQPGTSTPILETIRTSDQVQYLRKWNKAWAVVEVNGKVGYVLSTELTQPKAKSKAS